MITTVLALLFIVKPSDYLTQCLLYKTLQFATKKQSRFKFNIIFGKRFFYKIQHYTYEDLFSYANLGFYKINITGFFSVLLSNFNY